MIWRHIYEVKLLFNTVEVFSELPDFVIEILSGHWAVDIPFVALSGHNAHLDHRPDIHVVVVAFVEEFGHCTVESLIYTIRIL